MINTLMDKVFDFVSCQSRVTLKEIIIFMKQVGLNISHGDDNSIKNFKDDDFQRIIEAMMFDQRIEQTPNGTFVASNYNYPGSLVSFGKSSNDGGLTNSRIVYTEIPCCHCPLQSQCSAVDPTAVVNP